MPAPALQPPHGPLVVLGRFGTHLGRNLSQFPLMIIEVQIVIFQISFGFVDNARSMLVGFVSHFAHLLDVARGNWQIPKQADDLFRSRVRPGRLPVFLF